MHALITPESPTVFRHARVYASLQLCWALIALLFCQFAAAERIKDIASWSGVRSNHLIGYGLVVGLDGTGDRTTQTQFTVQTFKTMLANLGIQLPPGDIPKLKNVAAVILNAQLPAFSRPGQTIDVTVSSVANAKSLRGGTLLMAPLKGIDGVVYAVAQGNLVVGGFGAQGSDGSKITVNVPSAGNIPNGATVERAAPSNFGEGKGLTLLLNHYDFTTAQRVTYQINELLGSPVAAAIDGGAIEITAPLDKSQRVAFMSLLENAIVQPGIAAARVIVNSRTGTVVISQGVKVLPAAISHGNLTVTISEQPQVSQPAPFSAGQTAIVSNSSVEIEQQNSRMFLFNPGAQLKDIVAAVNDVGAAPGDLMAILEALKRAGALNAEILVI